MLDLVKLYRESTHFDVTALGYEEIETQYGVIYRHPEANFGPEVEACLSIGVFDGVHNGHKMLIDTMLEDARLKGINSIIMSFDPDPMEVIVGPQINTQLQDVEVRINSLLALEPSLLYVLHFDKEMKETSYQDFFDNCVASVCKLDTLHVGSNFRVGRGAQGDVEALSLLGAQRGFTVCGHDLLGDASSAVSASRIRSLIREGKLQDAYELLGHVMYVHGLVQKGRGEGAQFGFATANIEVWDRYVLPKAGVYSAFVELDGKLYPAAVNVGTPPMFGGSERLVEAHIIGFSGDIYGYDLRVFFIEYMRDSIKFDSLDLLISQVSSDILWVQDTVATTCVEVGLGDK